MIGVLQYTRRRYAPVRYNEFRPIEQTPMEQPIFGSLQPADGETLELLPEGFRVRDVRKFYTEGDLRGLDEESELPPDEVDVEGIVYQVHMIEPHGPGAPQPHRKAILVRKQL